MTKVIKRRDIVNNSGEYTNQTNGAITMWLFFSEKINIK